MSYRTVWFKRDLRWNDHAALAHAARLGPVRCLYVLEPDLWAQPDAALQHFEFVRESLLELQSALRAQGGDLVVLDGGAAILDLHAQGLAPQLADKLNQDEDAVHAGMTVGEPASTGVVGCHSGDRPGPECGGDLKPHLQTTLGCC